MTFEEAIQSAAELAVEDTVDLDKHFPTSVSLPVLVKGFLYCDVFEGKVKVGRTVVCEADARLMRTVGETSKITNVKWS